ncbi:beta-N-acetylglucosaminidase domain-containing protein [Mesobacillus foraminis]|uniref:Hyaluronoglucosaminidase n=1 Tax=Mesobacillus foraminis TaxID=279826 RepID=A0A4V6NKT3_9BACI|nr:beta-N-acetylglucosaminidase domain-containing protein [Mesobacillus foraminis]TCN27510.1 hyaluronoglucosaminidase [Mesobacillus foraminis]
MAKRKALKAVISACLVTGFLVPLNAPVTGNAKASGPSEIIVSPIPKSLEQTDKGFPLNPKVGLVTEKGTDPAAVAELKQLLQKAGVTSIVESDIKNPKLQEPVIIWLGEFSEQDELKTIRQQTGIENLEVTKKEGYIVASKHGTKNKKHIVISGHDEAGTFYGTQTFEQIIVDRKGTHWIPEVEIKDWPTMPIRGSIEGFYGAPWSHEDRLSQISFYGEHKMNSYIYAPKDDPYHREKWKVPYPEEKIQELAELVQTAQENHVIFTFAISPGNTITYSSKSDLDALIQKAEAMWDVGVRSFALYLDDIDPSLRSPEDRAMFGGDPNPPAAAQAYLLNRFNEEFIKKHKGAERLITVPTDYYQAGTTSYRERFAELVQSDIIVQWTGIGVVAPTITSQDADETHEIFKHDLLIWDNYPVNDFDRNRLFLAPLTGRDSDLTPEHGVIGLTANPMNEAEASKIPLFTVADYTWNPEAYDPADSLKRSLKEFSEVAYEPLKLFVEASYATSLNNNREPIAERVKPLIEQFWMAEEAKDNQAVSTAGKALLQEFSKMRQAVKELRDQVGNEKFLIEVAGYLNKLELYGQAGETAVDMVLARQSGDTAKAAPKRLELQQLRTAIDKTPQKLSIGVVPTFLERAINGKNLAEGKKAAASSSEVSWLTLDLAVDGNNNTRWASLYTDDQWISVDLGQVYAIDKVKLYWESAYGKQYKIQVSKDGSQWMDVYTELNSNGETDEIQFPAVEARYVKMQGIKRSSSWGYSLYEFSVYESQNK